jgi:hypothetical protein
MAVSKTRPYFEFHFIFSYIDFCSKVISELFCKAFKLVHWVSAFSQFWKFVKFTTNIIFIMNKLVHVLKFLTCIWELCYYDICQDADLKFSFFVCVFFRTPSRQIVWQHFEFNHVLFIPHSLQFINFCYLIRYSLLLTLTLNELIINIFLTIYQNGVCCPKEIH